ncbi:MAG: 2-isopropylmalate synthase [Candidatus Aenigmatarchaeota archaeon]
MTREKIKVFDTTLRDGEQASGFHMYPEQKLDIARALEGMGVDIIEAGNPISSPGDYKAVRTICENVSRPVIAGLARCVYEDIEAAGRALKPSIDRGKGRIHVYIATSNLHTDKKLKKSRDEISDMVSKSVCYAKRFTDDVQFSPEDYTRSDPSYTAEIICRAIEAGASTINLPDTVGYLIPFETRHKVRDTIESVNKKITKGVTFSIHCHNDLGNATANTIAGILGGARQIEVAMNGIGERAGNAALEEVVANIKERPDFFQKEVGNEFYTSIDTTKINSVSQKVSKFTGRHPQINKSIVGDNAFSHEAGVHQDGMMKDKKTYEWISPEDYGATSKLTFGPRSGRRGLAEAYRRMGLSFEKGEFDAIAERFVNISDGEKVIDHYHLAKAITGVEMVPRYQLISSKTWSDDDFGYAIITIGSENNRFTKKSSGSGMIDASVKAVNLITNLGTSIIDYKTESVNPGSDSKGMVSIMVGRDAFSARGYGLDSDVVRGSTKAYVDGVNKISYVLDTVKRWQEYLIF